MVIYLVIVEKTVIIGFDEILANVSLDEIEYYDESFEISQNDLKLGTVLMFTFIVIR